MPKLNFSVNKLIQRLILFDKKSSRNKRILYYFFYSAVFIFMILCVFCWFCTNNKSFIWKTDGLHQHFNGLVYYGDYLKGIVRNFLDTGKLSIPLWDFHIGYGSDIITTLHYYVIGDPLNLLSVFVPKANTEILYESLIIVRLYLAGISFSAYCHKRKKGRYQTLAGSFVYIFCGFALVAAAKHPFFINPMIYYPFVLLGIEKIFAKEKPYVFIIAVAISASSNFYFFYMITILMFLYAVIRYFTLFQEKRIKHFFQQLGKFIWYYLTGLFMACIIFLPVVLELISGNRWKVDRSVNITYSRTYYFNFITGFISPRSIGFWNVMGYCTLSLIAVLCLFSIKKRYKELKINFLVFTAILLIPAGGYVLNGFSYVSNRWVWGYGFLIAFILTSMIPELLHLSSKRLRAIVLMSAVYIMTFFYLNRMKKGIISIGIMFIAFIILLIANNQLRKKGEDRNKIGTVGIRILLMGFICINIIINAQGFYSPKGRNYINHFQNKGTSLNILQKNAAKVVQEIDDSGFYRYEVNKYEGKYNSNTSLQTKLNSTDYYFSVANGYVSQYLLDLNVNISNSYYYTGLNARAMPGTLACVKYFICRDGYESYLPYGYTKLVNSYKTKKGELYHAYENKYVLPLGYTYSNSISYNEYQTLTAIEKQQAMMQAVVLEETENSVSSHALQFTDKNMDYEMKFGKGVKLKGNTFHVNSKDAEVTLSFSGQEKCENYLNIINLYFKAKNKKDKTSEITISTSNIKKTFKLSTSRKQSYENIHDFSIHTGYSDEPCNQITIQFKRKGRYTFDKIEVINQPMDQFEYQTKTLKEDLLEDVKINTNSVSGVITLDTPKILCMSIPYSKGWKAYVDGVEEKLMRGNTMYMALNLTEGSHTIQLSYVTPGMREGIALFILGIFSLGIILVLDFKQNKKGLPGNRKLTSAYMN